MSTNETLIPWKEVKEINIKKFGGKRYVQVLLHHPEIADNARSTMGNMFAKSNAKQVMQVFLSTQIRLKK